MVGKEELIARLDTSMKFKMVDNVTAIIEGHNPDIADLLELSFYKKKEVAFRAAWMLEYLMTNRPQEFRAHVPALLSLLPRQKNPSAMRHYAKILALMTDRNADPVYRELSGQLDFDPVIEVLFTWLVDPETLVASKVHCMQALANLVPRYGWIKEELQETIEHLMGIESIAFFARAKMVKKQLKKYYTR
ncbi:hypothetical protein [Pedobacter africanus]|uniref:HEAT repeat-containing protein n=1 Tax=Pedobacter africanus TaxID=151894 RepID=A0A1W2DZ77_9SPHI|nr:hypothetical protein [Pedobacter africanus]SMD02729.1 hypothetical protein SAMN04488524_4291 [Pedobacter africanus]